MSNTIEIKTNMMVKPSAVFGGGKWAVAEMGMKRPSTWERKILRIHRPVVEQGI
jgi:hypothetical protein